MSNKCFSNLGWSYIWGGLNARVTTVVRRYLMPPSQPKIQVRRGWPKGAWFQSLPLLIMGMQWHSTKVALSSWYIVLPELTIWSTNNQKSHGYGQSCLLVLELFRVDIIAVVQVQICSAATWHRCLPMCNHWPLGAVVSVDCTPTDNVANSCTNTFR